MTPIPEDIKKLIKDEAWLIYPFDNGSNKIDRDRFLDGATFGYSLRQQELENKIIELDRMADESHAAFVISEQKNVTLESLITLKEFERQQWAGMCVKKSAYIEELNNTIAKQELKIKEVDNFAISFAVWTMYDPYAKEIQAAGATAKELLNKYKDRPYINPDTTKQ